MILGTAEGAVTIMAVSIPVLRNLQWTRHARGSFEFRDKQHGKPIGVARSRPIDDYFGT
jgi:hypothetical protein